MKIELIAKTIVFNADGRLLVLRRHENDEHRPGLWDLPGGQADAGETPQDAAKREASEEAGITIDNLRPVHVTSRIHDDCQVIKTVFTTRDYSGDIVLSNEHSHAEWIDIEAFYSLPISEDYKTALEMTQQQFSYHG